MVKWYTHTINLGSRDPDVLVHYLVHTVPYLSYLTE